MLKTALCLAAPCAALLIAAQPAHAFDAGDDWGPYMSMAINASSLEKPRQTIANAPTPGSTLQVVNGIKSGWGGAAAIGYRWRSWRLEAEYGRTQNPSKYYTAVTPLSITLPQDGKNDITRTMVNVYHDWSAAGGKIRPYLGVGVGSARDHVTTFAAPARAPMAPPSQLIDQTKTTGAWQAMAGVSLPVGRKAAFTLQYRWLDAGTVKGVDSRGERMTRKLHGGSYDIGFRYSF